MNPERAFRRLAWSGYEIFRRRRLREAALLGAAVLLPVLLLALGLGMLLRYHPAGGWITPILGLAALVLGAGAAVRFGMRHRLSYPEFLRRIERRLGLGENELVNAEEMEAASATMEDPLTRGLAELSVRAGCASLRGVSFPSLAPELTLRRPLFWTGGALAAGAVLFLLWPGAFLGAASRLVRPGTYDLPPALAIQVEPGNTTVERGASVRVRALLPGSRSEEPSLLHRAPGGAWKTVPMSPDSSGAREGRTSFAATLAGVIEPTDYAIAAGRSHSDTYRIQVIEPLRATGYQKRVEFPAYTGLAPQQELAADGNLSAVIGSKATLIVLASRPGAQGRLLPDGKPPIPLEPSGKDGLAATLAVREPLSYRVELTSREASSRWVSDPFRLDAVADRPPTLFQLAPERTCKLPPEMAVQLDLDCLDDFGLTRLDLVYRRNDGPPQRQTLSRWGGTREARVTFPWKLEGIAEVPGDRVVYHLELTDNDAVTGPKTTIGPDCEILYPTMDEIYAQVEDERNDQTADIKETLEAQRELKEDLQKIQNDLRQNKDIRWEQQEQLKDLADRQQQVADKVGDLTQSLERSLDRMQQANLFTPEMVQKVQEINQLAQQIQSPEFRDYLQKLQDAIRRLDRGQVNRALENLKLSQNELERNLDRTLEMLKQLQREETLDKLVNQAERMVEEQKRLNEQLGEKLRNPDQGEQTAQQSDSTSAASDSTGRQNGDQSKDQQDGNRQDQKSQGQQNQDQKDQDQSSKQGKQDQQGQGQDQKQQGQQSDQQNQGDQQKLTPEQAVALKQKQETLRAELQKLQQELQALQAEAEKKWQELQKQMEQRQSQQQLNVASKSMQSASQSMGSCNKPQSLRFGRDAEKNLQSFAQGMRQAQAQMRGAEQEEVTRELYRLSGELVQISKDQETLLQDAPGRTTRDLAEAEQRLGEGARKTLDRLYELGRKSRFITPELGQIMGQAVRMLDASREAFGDGDRGGGMSTGSSSSQALDQTVLALLNANQKMCNSGCSGSSSSNPMARMRSLSGQQESLNQDTQDMMGQMQGGSRLSDSGQGGDKLLQMAARQEMIRRGLQEVQESMGTQSNVLGRLDDIAKDMKDVEEQMRSHQVDERVLARQQKILSRLLTAQRSLHKEGDSEERVSRPGVNPENRPSPPPVQEVMTWQEALRRGILRGSQDPVPGDYRKLVEDYFRSLGSQK